MAKKARFHIFKRVTGHGEETLTLPANNQEDIRYYFENKDVKIIFIKSNIWKNVNMYPEGIGDIVFVDEDSNEYRKGNFGFEYLRQQYSSDYNPLLNATIPDDD
jgi:hypothetical protein